MDKFLNTFTFQRKIIKIHTIDMQFLWNIFLKEKNIENIIYKVELENILREKLDITLVII